MIKKLIIGLLILLLVALSIVISIRIKPLVAERISQDLRNQQVQLRDLSEVERYKLFLYEEVLRNDLTYRDFVLLRKIIQCESGWRQFDKNGNLLVSKKGDVGLFQISQKYHLENSKKLDYDISDWKDNLRFGVFLYKKDGSIYWNWSKRCWNSE